MAMCNCNPSTSGTEEYHTAFSDFEILSPEDWRTSTRYGEEAEGAPELVTSTPRRPSRRDPRRDFLRGAPGAPSRAFPRRLDVDLTAGVAIVPRRIDFDAASDIEEDDEEDLADLARERLQRLRSAAQRPARMPEFIPPGRPRGLTRAEYERIRRQYVPRMIRMTPCGKCLRI